MTDDHGRPLRSHSLPVVGAQHPNADGSDRRFEILICAPGETIELRPEPKNKHDPQAVAVYSVRSQQIGYLPAERAPRIGALIRQGREVRAIFQGIGGFGAWIRIAYDGEEPTLPPVRSSSGANAPVGMASDDDFYPDPEPSDWGA